MPPFEPLLTEEQVLMFYEGEKMISEGKRLIEEIQHTLSAYIPACCRQSFLNLITNLSDQSCRIGKIEQTIEQIKIMQNHFYEKNAENQKDAEKEKVSGPPSSEQAILYGYAENQGVL